MTWMPVIVVAVPLTCAVAMRYSDKVFGEFDNYFVYCAWGTVILMMLIAVYLSYAFPSIAGGTRYDQPVPVQNNASMVTNTEEIIFDAR